jgi:hypothetical protein
MCSRVSLLLYNPTRYPNSSELLLLLGFMPSYFPTAITSYLPIKLGPSRSRSLYLILGLC